MQIIVVKFFRVLTKLIVAKLQTRAHKRFEFLAESLNEKKQSSSPYKTTR